MALCTAAAQAPRLRGTAGLSVLLVTASQPRVNSRETRFRVLAHGGPRGLRVVSGDGVEDRPVIAKRRAAQRRGLEMFFHLAPHRAAPLIPEHLHHRGERPVNGGARDRRDGMRDSRLVGGRAPRPGTAPARRRRVRISSTSLSVPSEAA